MINLSASGGSITFEFSGNSGYLQEGVITCPVNSLSLILESDSATFRKSASNDIFVSARYEDFGMSKAELETWFKNNAVGSTGGGGDITSGEVQTMIDESISGKADSVSAVSSAEYVSSSTTIDFKNVDGDVISSIDASDFVIDGMIDDVRIETISGTSYLVIDFNTASGKEDIQIPLTDIFDPSNYYTKSEVDGAISGKADTSAVTAVNDVLTAHTANTNIHVTSEEKSTWNAKSDFSGSYNDLTDKPTIPTVPTNVSAFNNDAGYATSGYVDSAVSGKQDTLVSGTNIKTINNQSLLGSGNIDIQGGGGSGNPTVELTQAQYDALVESGTVEPNTYYIITDATPIDISNYYTSAQTESAISAATSGLQETLVSGTNIKTINNESILGSGNITIQGGGGVDSGTVQTMIDESISGKQDTLSAGTGISIVDNVISATGGGGGMTEDDELILATALTDLNDRKIDASEVKINYQRKGDYVTTSALNTRLADYETALDEQNVEEVASYALNDLNERLTALETAVQALQELHNNE